MLVYLSGPIDEADEKGARDWRQQAKRFFQWYETEHTKGQGLVVRCLDPLRGKESSIDKADYSPAELVLRDVADIKKADIVLCHFAPKDSYQTWGTPSECALAAYFRKPVVFVCPSSSPLRRHPWARYQAIKFFVSLEDACKYIAHMWR